LRQQTPASDPEREDKVGRSEQQMVEPQKRAQEKSIKKDNFDGKNLGTSPPIPRIK